MMVRMDKKIVLVTGASRGIGRAIALQLGEISDYIIVGNCNNSRRSCKTK